MSQFVQAHEAQSRSRPAPLKLVWRKVSPPTASYN
jgi:hypothetical protein